MEMRTKKTGIQSQFTATYTYRTGHTSPTRTPMVWSFSKQDPIWKIRQFSRKLRHNITVHTHNSVAPQAPPILTHTWSRLVRGLVKPRRFSLITINGRLHAPCPVANNRVPLAGGEGSTSGSGGTSEFTLVTELCTVPSGTEHYIPWAVR